PKPLTSVTVSPRTPTSASASFTSSSLKGLMIASIFFMRSGSRQAAHCTCTAPPTATEVGRPAPLRHARRQIRTPAHSGELAAYRPAAGKSSGMPLLPRRPLQLDPRALAQRRLRNFGVVAVL